MPNSNNTPAESEISSNSENFVAEREVLALNSESNSTGPKKIGWRKALRNASIASSIVSVPAAAYFLHNYIPASTGDRVGLGVALTLVPNLLTSSASAPLMGDSKDTRWGYVKSTLMSTGCGAFLEGAGIFMCLRSYDVISYADLNDPKWFLIFCAVMVAHMLVGAAIGVGLYTVDHMNYSEIKRTLTSIFTRLRQENAIPSDTTELVQRNDHYANVNDDPELGFKADSSDLFNSYQQGSGK